MKSALLPLLLIVAAISHLSTGENTTVVTSVTSTTEESDLKEEEGVDVTAKSDDLCTSGVLTDEQFSADCTTLNKTDEAVKNDTESTLDEGSGLESTEASDLSIKLFANEISTSGSPEAVTNESTESTNATNLSTESTNGTSQTTVSTNATESTTVQSSETQSKSTSEGQTQTTILGFKEKDPNNVTNPNGKSVGDVKESTAEQPKKAGSKDTLVLVVMFVGVVAIGAVAFGYNYIKKKRRRAEDEERPATRTEQGPSEAKPLMERKEIEMAEVKPEQNGASN